MQHTLLVADEVWIVMASLHQFNPERTEFPIKEIIEQAEIDNHTNVKPLRSSVKVHIYQHCVANKPPNPGRHRMLFETTNGHRRLYRPGDPCHPRRVGGKDRPNRHEIPKEYHHLLDWYVQEYLKRQDLETDDPILSLRGLGKEIWANENADEFVQRQRAGWQ